MCTVNKHRCTYDTDIVEKVPIFEKLRCCKCGITTKDEEEEEEEEEKEDYSSGWFSLFFISH